MLVRVCKVWHNSNVHIYICAYTIGGITATCSLCSLFHSTMADEKCVIFPLDAIIDAACTRICRAQVYHYTRISYLTNSV